ncbi:DUF748 domain-containing protein [Ideonella sp. 4Y16]|uniref:DUF748 domain-containing protein n=1 Tax=Ideonella alba TaxID=2824118 RepID=UPI001B36CB21|nr:DUF748 domain-containing protein [Ideonella alba]MBQ0943999.1 DUF748 domain-containing protein [Ideonella alba]
MTRSRVLIVLALLGALLLGLFAAYRVALQRLEAGLREALGPRATVGAIEVGWTGLRVRELHVAAAPGWPADEELHAGLVTVRPDLASAFSGAWRVQRIVVEDARIVLLRTRDGRLRVLPSMLETGARAAAPAASATTPAPAVLIDHIVLRGVQVDLFDASLALPRPHRIRLADLNATLDTLVLPGLDRAMDVDLSATLKGPAHDGQVAVRGQLTPATREAELAAALTGIDMRALQPYLLKVNDGGIRQGRLDLQVQASVRGQRLKAPGRMVLTGLELADGSGLLGRLGSLSRQAAVAALRNQGRITLDFTLQGRLDDPAFSINDSLAQRFATGVAEAVGVSLGGVVEGVGNVIKGLFGR